MLITNNELIYKTASPILLEYDYSHLFDAVKFINGQDYMTLGCIETAKTDLNGIDTFKQFGEIVAQQLIEKYNLQKKGTTEYEYRRLALDKSNELFVSEKTN